MPYVEDEAKRSKIEVGSEVRRAKEIMSSWSRSDGQWRRDQKMETKEQIPWSDGMAPSTRGVLDALDLVVRE